MPYVDVHEAREQLSTLVERARNGEDVVLTENKRPLARLVATGDAPAPSREPGSAKGMIQIGDDFDEPLDDLWEHV